ncbi:MAG: CotS family spore coat protein [Roseburia sp.]|nr:CotS family spore coat protein [Roseburia sp.]
MYSRPEQLLEKYPITVKSFSKGRECYLCDTNLGSLALREYRGSKERASFLEAMLEHLKSSGLSVECIVKTSDGEILVVDEEERRFLLTENYRGAECDVWNQDDMVAAVRVLARLHNAAKNFREEVPEMIYRNWNSLLEVYERHNREIKQVNNYIRTKKKKNSFEMLFHKQCEFFLKKAQTVTEALKDVECEPELYGFCHGDYNQHSIIFAKQGVAIVGLERFTYDIQVRDLANFVRKMMEKNNWDVELGRILIEAYNEIHPLKEQERAYLYFYLAYPEKFWKLANHYNSAHKTWLSERNIEKLEKVIAQEEKKEQFLSLLFSERIGYT